MAHGTCEISGCLLSIPEPVIAHGRYAVCVCLCVGMRVRVWLRAGCLISSCYTCTPRSLFTPLLCSLCMCSPGCRFGRLWSHRPVPAQGQRVRQHSAEHSLLVPTRGCQSHGRREWRGHCRVTTGRNTVRPAHRQSDQVVSGKRGRAFSREQHTWESAFPSQGQLRGGQYCMDRCSKALLQVDGAVLMRCSA